MSAPPGNVTAAMLTTITVNGYEGFRFLERLGTRVRRPLPPALLALIDHVSAAQPEVMALEVESWLAEEIADLVELFGPELASAGEPPLLFSAGVGDTVVLVRDVLAEIKVARHEPRTWRALDRDTHGRVVARRGDVAKLLLLDGEEEGAHAYVSDRCMTRVR